MVFFNDPLPCPDPAAARRRLALEMRDAVAALVPDWRKRGHELGFGIGMAQGYATLGRIGFEDRFDYTAIGASSTSPRGSAPRPRAARSWSSARC